MSEPGGEPRRERIADSAVATGKGDDGTTGMLFGGRIAKDDARVDAYGTVDEAVSAMGLARAELRTMSDSGRLPDALTDLPALLLRLQRELFVVGAELAANPEARDRLTDGVTQVHEPMLTGVEDILRDAESRMTMPREFVVPGETRLSAALELARTVMRRAERRVIGLARSGETIGPWVVPYLNRVADLLWVLARMAEQGESAATVPSRPDQSRRST